jgi:hypothetical protein
MLALVSSLNNKKTTETNRNNDPSLWNALEHRRDHMKIDQSHNNGSIAIPTIQHSHIG